MIVGLLFGVLLGLFIIFGVGFGCVYVVIGDVLFVVVVYVVGWLSV